MRIKSYFASSVQAAMRQAREELGPDAVIIESHAAPEEARRLGELEVVFGVTETAPKQEKAKRAPKHAVDDDLASEMKMLRTQVDALKAMLQPAAEASPASEGDELRQELIAADLDPDLATALVEMANAIRRNSPAPRSGPAKEVLRRIVEASIRGRLRVSSTIGLGGPNDQSTVVFVGPPGAGKTTTLAKIAVKRCLAARLTVRIVSVDAERVGSHERLRTLAGVMGIGFTAANSIPELQDALKESRTKDCLLIDTPGFGNGDSDAARDLALVLNRAAPCDIHLVLPACAKRADLAAFADRFGVFRPGKLLFTRLDETSSLGCVVSEALRLEKPLSFFSTGQSIPDDLQEANAEMLVEKLFAADAAAAASAA